MSVEHDYQCVLKGKCGISIVCTLEVVMKYSLQCLFCSDISRNVVVGGLKFLPHTEEDPGSNFGPETGCRKMPL
jgi:hypothetical protein